MWLTPRHRILFEGAAMQSFVTALLYYTNALHKESFVGQQLWVGVLFTLALWLTRERRQNGEEESWKV